MSGWVGAKFWERDEYANSDVAGNIKVDGITTVVNAKGVLSVVSGSAGPIINVDTINENTSGHGIVVTNDTRFNARISIASSGATDAIGIYVPSSNVTAYSMLLPDTQGAANTVLTNDGSGNLSWAAVSGGGLGDVTGPAASVANQIAYFSDTTGKVVAASGVLAYNNGDMTANSVTSGTSVMAAQDVTAEKFLVLDQSSGNKVTIDVAAAIVADYTLTLPVRQGASNSVILNDGNGSLSWSYISNTLPKRWQFGRRRFKWKSGMPTTGFTLTGAAQVLSTFEDHHINLTPATNFQFGRLFYDFGSDPSITDWEMQIVLRSGSGGDGFHVFANSDITGAFFSSDPNFRLTNLSNVSASAGHQLFINQYQTPSNYFVKLYDGSSNIATQVDKPTDLNNGQPQKISFRKIGTTLTVELLNYRGSNNSEFLYEGTTVNTHNGRYWGIASFTGSTNTTHDLHSIELRTFDGQGDLYMEN